MMFPQSRHSGSSHLPQQLKFTTSDSCDRIKDEFQLLQAQYHSLKLECDKLASEKSEMQRHYVMYYEMSYGLNIEMHKQAEIVKRLNGICAQVLPYLSQEHQQQVLGAIERAKQVTAPEQSPPSLPQVLLVSCPPRPSCTNTRPNNSLAVLHVPVLNQGLHPGLEGVQVGWAEGAGTPRAFPSLPLPVPLPCVEDTAAFSVLISVR
uniref:TLE family member 5, transcriptional modulator n=1 Tax=Junco hyemalis TaxID=40217 RepID=A0A8C5IR97_JUNHY